MDFLKKFDSSGRTPRDVQVRTLEWLAKHWNDADAFALQLPVACGKSAIAKAIVDAAGGHVVTPSNILINQYRATYTSTNFLQGKSHYTCDSGLTCEDWTTVLEQAPCKGCPYMACKQKALQGQQTFFNPMSLYYSQLNKEWHAPPVLVIDEAHQLPSMISMLSGTRLRHSMYKFNDSVVSELHLVPWLNQQITNLSKLSIYYAKDRKRLKEVVEELERLKLVKIGVESDAGNYAIWIERGLFRGKPDRFLNIKPIKPPRAVVDSLLDARRVVLLSGTLMPSDVRDLVGGRRTMSLDLPSPIPKERRPIYYRPVAFKMNMETPAAPIVAAIESIIKENPGKNTIVHVSYALGKKLRGSFSIPIIFNDPEDKPQKLEYFLRHGGIFLAAGCSEGLDLKGDLCHINIITKLLFPNLGDPVVAKRKSLEDGDEWLALETLKTTIQQAGRSTRSVDDYSKTYILDNNFARVFRKYKDRLPQSFNDSISWSGR